MRWRDSCLAVLVAFAWGGYFPTSKITLETFSPALLGFLRFFLVFLITVPFFKSQKLNIKLIISLSLVYFLSNIVIYTATTQSDHLIPLAIMNQLVCPFSTILGIIFLGEKISSKEMLGLVIILLGASLVISYRSASSVELIAVILSVIAAFLFAVYNFVLRKVQIDNPLALISQVSLAVSALFLVTAVFKNEIIPVKNVSINSLYGLIYSVLITTLFANLSWFYLLQKYPLKKVTPFTVLIPIFGSLICVISFKEKINVLSFVGIVMVIVGLVILEYKNARSKQQV